MITLNELRKSFNAGTSFRWSIKMLGKDSKRFNILNGRYMPVTKVDFKSPEVKSAEIPITPYFSLQIPYATTPIDTLELTIEDDENRSIRTAMTAWVSEIKGQAKNIEEYARQLQIDIYHPDHSYADSKTLYVVPKDGVAESKSYDIASDNYPLTLTVVGEV